MAGDSGGPGVSGSRRAPDHYALLGLEAFCEEIDVIDRAARREIDRLKRRELHRDADRRVAIQKLMGGIAGARAVLTDPSQKRRYDASLAQKIGLVPERPAGLITVVAGLEPIGQSWAIPVGRRVVIGSGVNCDVRLACDRVGEEHCLIHNADGRWAAEAADDTRPLQVNDRPCERRILHEGDAIGAGTFVLRFSVDASSPARPRGPVAEALHLEARGPRRHECCRFAMLGGQRAVIGSDPTARWFLDDCDLGPRHCEVRDAGGRWVVQNLTAETMLVNGLAVTVEPLCDGDEITLAGCRITVTTDSSWASRDDAVLANGVPAGAPAAPVSVSGSWPVGYTTGDIGALAQAVGADADAEEYETLVKKLLAGDPEGVSDGALVAEGLRLGMSKKESLRVIRRVRSTERRFIGVLRRQILRLGRSLRPGRRETESRS